MCCDSEILNFTVHHEIYKPPFHVKGHIHGTRSTDVEDSHRLSNPTLNGKIWTLNDNDDDDDSCQSGSTNGKAPPSPKVYMYKPQTTHSF